MLDKVMISKESATLIYDNRPPVELNTDKGDIVELVQYFLDWKTPLQYKEYTRAVIASLEDTVNL